MCVQRKRIRSKHKSNLNTDPPSGHNSPVIERKKKIEEKKAEEKKRVEEKKKGEEKPLSAMHRTFGQTGSIPKSPKFDKKSRRLSFPAVCMK